MTTYMTTYKLGDYVDIVCNGAIHKGMPYRFYHGRTGKVWNITKSAIGVQVNKQIKGRIISKRIHVRVEHVKQSRCIEEFKNRVARNEKAKSDAKRTGSEFPARYHLIRRLEKLIQGSRIAGHSQLGGGAPSVGVGTRSCQDPQESRDSPGGWE
jgi:ribosomal protein L21E